MAIINPSLVYADGSVLDTEGHNKNIYTVESANEGILSVANGGLDNGNIDAKGISLSPEHVQSEQGMRTRQEFMLESIDCFQDRFGTADDHTTPITAGVDYWKNVPGCGIRFYLPYKATILLQWSFFISPFRVLRYTGGTEGDQAGGTKDEEATMLVAAKYGVGDTKTLLRHTERGVPLSAFFKAPVGSSPAQQTPSVPNKKCVYWDMSHMVQSAAAGWHELNLSVYMNKLSTKQNYQWSGIVGEVDRSSYFMQRLSFGVRNARVLVLNTF
jgi:hypothetical protein